MVGSFWIFFASLELREQWFKQDDQLVGFIMIVLSGIIYSFQITLENRIFKIEPDLTALGLQQAISMWKMTLLLILFVLGNIFSESLGDYTGSNTDSLAKAYSSMNEEPELWTFMILWALFNGLQANFGM